MNASMMMATIGTVLVLMLAVKTTDKRDKLLEMSRRTLTGLSDQLELSTPTYALMGQTRPTISAKLALQVKMGLSMMVEQMTVLGRLGVSTVSARGFYPMQTWAQQRRAADALGQWALHMAKWAQSSVKCMHCACIGVSNAVKCPATLTTMMARQTTENQWNDGEYEMVVSEPQMRNHSGQMNTAWVMEQTTREQWVLARQHAVYGNRSVCDQMVAAFDAAAEV
mgnify:FL=1|tara:strand:+ start:63 stop:734 length:672 start_codon:yes stop_codon:yes gene_type:complete